MTPSRLKKRPKATTPKRWADVPVKDRQVVLDFMERVALVNLQWDASRDRAWGLAIAALRAAATARNHEATK